MSDKEEDYWYCFTCKQKVDPDFKSRYHPKCPNEGCDDEPMWMEVN